MSNVKSKSDKLRLQIALVEDAVSYSGENGNRFHEMVVRSLANGPPPGPAGRKPLASQPEPAAKPASGSAPAETSPLLRQRRPQRREAGAARRRSPPGSRCSRARAAASSGRSTWRRPRPTPRRTWRTSKRTPARARTRSARRSTRSTPGNLSVVAFVQDEATKKILQAVYVKMPAAKADK